jgi:hypothetical protein
MIHVYTRYTYIHNGAQMNSTHIELRFLLIKGFANEMIIGNDTIKSHISPLRTKKGFTFQRLNDVK